jgi:pimeloyl-ACP methyl ester carboxylesterase
MRKVLFLPGASGACEFWRPVARRLPDEWDKILFAWPGLGNQPHDQKINGIEDLVQLVKRQIDQPVDLVAQSMGGVVAACIALDRLTAVRRLVLAVTSAGVNMAQFGAADWRADYRRQFPQAADWITRSLITEELLIELITAPTLLIWGDSDPVSPVAVGHHLEHRLPNAKLRIVAGGDHGLASNKAELVAALIAGHLT